jgi:hypothetical protein
VTNNLGDINCVALVIKKIFGFARNICRRTILVSEEGFIYKLNLASDEIRLVKINNIGNVVNITSTQNSFICISSSERIYHVSDIDENSGIMVQ